MTQELNKFEKTRLLSARALELSQGDKPKLDTMQEALISKDYVKIAEEEFEKDKLELEVIQQN